LTRAPLRHEPLRTQETMLQQLLASCRYASRLRICSRTDTLWRRTCVRSAPLL
jgi:hypothetical protein